MSAAGEVPSMPATLLGFESGGRYWLVDIADAGEVLPLPDLCEVPLTRPWFRGIANIRGTLYSVTDLAVFHGAGLTQPGPRVRLLLAGAPLRAKLGGNMALLMAATQGIQTAADYAVEDEKDAAAATLSKDRPWCGPRYRDSEGRTWTRLSLPLLMSSAEFLDIAA